MLATDFNKTFTHHTVVVNGVRLHYVILSELLFSTH